jgi:hypothetical protein
MRTPVMAMLWESWRLTWRQVIFFAVLASFSGWAMLAGASNRLDRGGYVVFMLLVLVSVMALMSMCVVNGRAVAGFPYPLAFGRPVRTSLLVAVPMFYRAVVCAAIYALPTVALRAAFEVPFPLLPVAALLAASATLFLASTWLTRDATSRTLMFIATLVALPAAVRWLSPRVADGVFPPPVAPDMIELTLTDYALIALAVAGGYFVTVRGVDRQRHGEAGSRQLPRATAQPAKATPRGVVEYFRDAAVAIVRAPCPTSSPLAAELWIETKSRGLPVLAIGLVIALCIPVLFVVGNALQWNVAVIVTACMTIVPALPFFAGIGASFWNRDASLRSPMNAFEATRPIATARLAAVQIAVAIGGILAAWILIAVSLRFSLSLAGSGASFGPLQQGIAAAIGALSFGRLASLAVVGLVAFATVVAFLAAIRAFAVLYGKRLWIGALGIALYAIFAVFAIATERWSIAIVGAHLWAFALAIPTATVFVLVRALAARIVLPRQAVAVLVVWFAFAAAGGLVVRDSGFALDALAPAVAALVLAGALLPLTASMLAVWSLGLIRHA